MIRIYTKPKGQIPDYNEPVILHDTNPTLEMFCNRIHRVRKAVLSLRLLSPPYVPFVGVIYRAGGPCRFFLVSHSFLRCRRCSAEEYTHISPQAWRRRGGGNACRSCAPLSLSLSYSGANVCCQRLRQALPFRPVRVQKLLWMRLPHSTHTGTNSEVLAKGMSLRVGSQSLLLRLPVDLTFPPLMRPFRRDRKCAHNPAYFPGYIAPPQVRVGVGVEREAPADEDGQGPPPQRRGRSADCQEGLGPFFFLLLCAGFSTCCSVAEIKRFYSAITER